MDGLTAERVSAYHDRELAAEEAARLGAHLAGDPQARALLEAFIRADDEARAAFDAELEAPVPLALARRVRQGFAARRRRAMAHAALRWVGPAAAAIAILVAGNQWMQHRAEQAMAQREARIAALTNRTVQKALETAVSGVAVAMSDKKLDGTVSITPIRTYRSRNQQWCREFVEHVTVEGKALTRYGLACRGTDGAWHRLLTRTPGYEPPPLSSSVL